MTRPEFDVAVIGAGSIGLSVAYYLVKRHGLSRIAIIDPRDPMSLTSAQSGENYRNWWPHPVMTAFTDDSIAAMEEIARETGNRIAMTRRGYALATRRSAPPDLIDGLYRGYAGKPGDFIRVHDGKGARRSYQRAAAAGWETAPDGVDVLLAPGLIRQAFPSYAEDIKTVLHIRRAGSISSQQLGQHMLESVRAAGGRLIRGTVTAIRSGSPFALDVATADATTRLDAGRIVNAAGPFLTDIAALFGESLPIRCVYQQKTSFKDARRAVPRDLPFSIDLDGQIIDWTDEERALLASDPATAPLIAPMPGSIHCRPDGGDGATWIKLGWAFNASPGDPHLAEPLSDQFPEIVLRAASRLQPALKSYGGVPPAGLRHYGGYYTMTEENWPLIGPMRTPGAFVAGALSGFGTMAACSTGEICAAWVMGSSLPPYAAMLSTKRYDDPALVTELKSLEGRGVL